MREPVSIATFLILLAFIGVEPGKADITKTCRTGGVISLFKTC